MKESRRREPNSVLLLLGGLVCMVAISTLLSTFPSLFSQRLIRIMDVGKTSSSELPTLLNITIEKALEGLKLGHFTSVDLVKAYLARIEEGSEFKAVLQVNHDAISVAQQLDDERVHSGSIRPLHGIPVLVKDNIVTKDKLDASAGSYALLGAKPVVESSVISKLRAAGVIILGKTNLSEWANFRGLNISDGWSPRGGQTLGVYYPHSKSEGSSSGSAVATALGLCTAALGTETMGSIVDPAELSNVVGFKPTRGLIGTDAAIPISKRQDVIGSLTRTVKDAAYMLSCMAGRSDLDDRTWHIPFDPIPDFTTFCKGTDLNGFTIGIPRNSFSTNPPAPIMASFESAMKKLNSAGAKIVDSADFVAAEEFKKLDQQVKGIVRSSEFNRDMANYLQSLETNPNNIHSVEDIINFTKTFPAEDYPERDIGKFLWTQAEGINVDSDKYNSMVEQELYFGGEGGILGTMQKYNLDVLAVPSNLGIANDLAAKMGFPVISVPLGFWPEDTPVEKEDTKPGLVTAAPGIPYSITFVTKAFSDGKLLQVAYAFEQLTAVRDKGPLPFKTPTTELKDVLKKDQEI